MATTNHPDSVRSPVLIVGGGPTGLFLSLLLARYNVPCIVFEKLSVEERFQHPQAHFLNTRTMEILRHSLPRVYQKVQQAMAPVTEWHTFRLGGANLRDPNAIVVQHPVDIPIQANRDANGIVVRRNDDDDDDVFQEERCSTREDLSPVTVGHLPQHVFGKILYEEAVRMASTTTLFYDTEVTHITSSSDVDSTTATTTGVGGGGVVQLHTRNGPTVTTESWCIGADGAHSLVRRHCGIQLHGTASMQHLMNIHVQRQQQHPAMIPPPPAMLYATFAPRSVAMTVRHSADEYIVQIPYFPPYQTVQDDFTRAKLVEIVSEIFGEPIPDSAIVSAKPWTMGSLVAQRYVQDQMILVGDAAHVFPPAGGFGMNTGLQDAHNLAWKIAVAAGTRTMHHNNNNNNNTTSIGTSYEQERRPVAQRNAALSVRNYERLLKVTQAAYLDHRHPELLHNMLDHTSSLLPLPARQAVFRSLYQAALYPFRWLVQRSGDSMYAHHIRSNMRSALNRGMGLPLLFPSYEIGFSYHGDSAQTANNNNDPGKSRHQQWMLDTIPSQPVLAIGALMPHTNVTVVTATMGAETVDRTDISTTVDLPAQLHIESTAPIFVLFCWKPRLWDQNCLQEIAAGISSRLCGLLVRIVLMSDTTKDLKAYESDVVLLLASKNSSFSNIEPCIVLIRPDGHVSGIVYSQNTVTINVVDHLIRFSI
jgi:2-polyprenyl-6-methoxyphenol hydroxylase-like FAD-dependent oxidoreductase